MKTMKFFRNLLILFIFIFIFVNIVSRLLLQSTYNKISELEVISENPLIEIIEAKANKVGGMLIAKITNNTGEVIDNQYIKLDFLSKYGNNLGTKYLKVNNLQST